MNTMELNVAMLRNRVSALDMADVLMMSRVSFNKRRDGHTPFLQHEIVLLAQALNLTAEQVNIIFFDGNLPDSKYVPASVL